jgi:hypothetical protein
MLFIYTSIYHSTVGPLCFSVIWESPYMLSVDAWNWRGQYPRDFLGRPLRLLSGMGVREIGYLV